MLEFPVPRSSSLVFAMNLLFNYLGEEIIETDKFYWNPLGEDEDMPNFWDKTTNLQMEWYRDDPGRGGFTNFEEENSQVAMTLLMNVRESYATHTGREKA